MRLTNLLFTFLLASGSAQAVTWPASTPADDGPISVNRSRALAMFNAITGLKAGIDDTRVVQMEALIASGKEREAAHLAVQDKAFIDLRIQNLAKRLSSRDETPQAGLTDFVATFAGAVRDNLDARTLLTGNYIYRSNTSESNTHVPLYSPATNSHYGQVEALHYSLNDTLMKQSPQQLSTGPLNDNTAAGLITTYGFMSAHAQAGTNRRMVEYTFREFMCTPLANMMDATRPDDFVGRDVDRYAGGGTTTFLTTCKGCHAQMDGFRQAFAYMDFQKGGTYTPGTIPAKMNRNNQIYPQGKVTTDENFVNYVTGSANASRFGWRSDSMKGTGPHDLGKMISESKGFSNCMVQHLFEEICKRTPASTESGIVSSLATQFETTYSLKDLAEIVAIHPACIKVTP